MMCFGADVGIPLSGEFANVSRIAVREFGICHFLLSLPLRLPIRQTNIC